MKFEYISVIMDDDVETLEAHIDRGLNVNQSNRNYRTFLHVASAHNSPKCAKLLIEEGADIEDARYLGQTPFQLACTSNSKDCAEMLIEAGANLEEVEDLLHNAYVSDDVKQLIAPHLKI